MNEPKSATFPLPWVTRLGSPQTRQPWPESRVWIFIDVHQMKLGLNGCRE